MGVNGVPIIYIDNSLFLGAINHKLIPHPEMGYVNFMNRDGG